MTRYTILLSVVFLNFVCTRALAQSYRNVEADRDVIARISLGVPGNRIPIVFNAPTGAKLRLLEISVQFQSKDVRFVGFDAEKVSDAVRMETQVAASALPDGDVASTTIMIRVFTNDEKGIPPSRLGDLRFVIDPKKINAGVAVALKATLSATEIGAQKPLAPEKVRADGGWVAGDLVIVDGCFFFTH